MAYYDFMVEPFAMCIEAGITSIDEVFPDDLKQKVIAFLASKGLGPDGKPLPKEPEKPDEEVEEPKDSTTEEEKEEVKDEPKEPVEEAKEDEPSKDTKEEDKSPVEEDKGAK